MTERVVAWSLRHRRAALFAAACVGLLGAWAFADLPIDAIPDLSENQQLVAAEWPGHGPREIEARVTASLARRLLGIPGVRTLRASSEVGFALVHLIFEDRVGVAEGRRRVAERLAAPLDLPEGVKAALGPEGLPTGQVFWYTLEGAEQDLGALRDLQDGFVGPALASVPGVAEVASVGGFLAEYRVDVDLAALQARGVPLRQVASALAAESGAGSQTAAAGNVERIAEVSIKGAAPGDPPALRRTAAARALEALPLAAPSAAAFPLSDVAAASAGAAPRRGALEKDGNEAVGGIVLMRWNANPRAVCRAVRGRMEELRPGLPPGVRIVPFYDRTTLVDAAVATVTRALVESIAVAALVVVLVLRHWRTALVVASALPVAVAAAFAGLWALRQSGWAGVEVNAMSLAGIAISIGALVDSTMVLCENVLARLRERFGDAPIVGDTRPEVLAAYRLLGGPVTASLAMMLASFLPLFALAGFEGRMFAPFVATKSLLLAAVAVLGLTLTPALCSLLMRGRVRDENDSFVVRGAARAYRPLLAMLLDRPAAIVWLLGVPLMLGLAAAGHGGVWQTVCVAVLASALILHATARGRWLAFGLLALIALAARSGIAPLPSEFLVPLDEQMAMDMPITVPGIPLPQAIDDLKARDMALCRFPEVGMVVGKVGRADTATDPAPTDMIETMVELLPERQWPRRVLDAAAAERAALRVGEELARRALTEPPGTDADARIAVVAGAAAPAVELQLREYAYRRRRELSGPANAELAAPALRAMDDELADRASQLFARLAAEEFVARADRPEPAALEAVVAAREFRRRALPTGATMHHGARSAFVPDLVPHPALEAAIAAAAADLRGIVRLAARRRPELSGPGGELDRAVSMPGWVNVWTMPIQNRVDMLSTGVNTAVGVRVFGPTLDKVAEASAAVAAAVQRVPGAAQVVADPIRGRPHLEVVVDPQRCVAAGLGAAEVAELAEVALGGRIVGFRWEGSRRIPIRLRAAGDRSADPDALRALPLPTPADTLTLGSVAEIRTPDGPAAIKSENGRLRNYVRFNARGRDAAELVEAARATVAAKVALPEGVHLEWTGQFEHQLRARRTLAWVAPAVVAAIFLGLWLVFRDWGDACLMMLAIPGAAAGGLLAQWWAGQPFSMTVWAGYLACFSMAASTGVVMLAFLRESLRRAGPLESLTDDQLRTAALEGAVLRLRPKLLTEATMVLSLIPMLWATGVASEIIRPMAVPVLGGVLLADEAIDLFLPVAFLWSRRRRRRRLLSMKGLAHD